jgi:hypothetical protein
MPDTKTKHSAQETVREVEVHDDQFGWVWMAPAGTICGACRTRQPQSKDACLAGHRIPLSDRMSPGIPIPWTAK